MLPLFKQFPALRKKLHHFSLGKFPTPVKKLKNLTGHNQSLHIYIKKDNLSGRLYGGNKTRKLEFLLGEALWRKSGTIVTFGAAGSNHALATSVYSALAGLKSVSVLFPQRRSPAVGKNLLAGYNTGADLQYIPDFKAHKEKTSGIIKKISRHDKTDPFIIPPGGSSPLGTIGFVNAAFELKLQIEKGLLPEPDLIYLPSGTMGTCTGLLLGLTAAGLKSRIMAVKVTPRQFSNEKRIEKLFSAANHLLHSHDPSFPVFAFPHAKFQLRQGYLGAGYGIPTRSGTEAVRVMREKEKVNLEGTYTGKTIAALLDDLNKGYLDKKYILYWNTYNSRDIFKASDKMDYRQLPAHFHMYFK